MSSPGFPSYSLLSGNTNRGHPTASTRPASPENSLEAFYVEDSCAYLTRFETVVLVDGSISMLDLGWQQASDLLADMTKLVAKFHPNGLELHFSNQPNYDSKNATTPEFIRRMFAIVQPAELSSPIATLLKRELSEYISRYRSNSKLRGLNLLVLTNGVQDNEYEIKEIISKASYEMSILGAAKEQISIQFLQIGSSRAVQNFLEGLGDANVMGLQADHIVSTP